MATNPTALWCRAPVEGNQIYPILELQTPTLSRLLYPVREGTFLIGREDWASEGRVSQKKKMDLWGWSNHNLKTVLRESEAFFS